MREPMMTHRNALASALLIGSLLTAAALPVAAQNDAATAGARAKLLSLTGLPSDRELALYAQFCATVEMKEGDANKAPFGLNDEQRSKRNLYRFKWLDEGKQGSTGEMGVGTGTIEDFTRAITEIKQKGELKGWEHIGVGLSEPDKDGGRACYMVVGKREAADADALKKEREELIASTDVGSLGSPNEQRSRFLQVVNENRQKVGLRAANNLAKGHPKVALAPLAFDDRLNAAAQHQAEQLKWMFGTLLMADIGNSHDGLPFVGHYDLGDRIGHTMPKNVGSAEAISTSDGKDPAAQHVNGWMKSETHFRPFLDLQGSDDAGFDTRKAERFKSVGYGYVVDAKGGHWGVALFGKEEE